MNSRWSSRKQDRRTENSSREIGLGDSFVGCLFGAIYAILSQYIHKELSPYGCTAQLALIAPPIHSSNVHKLVLSTDCCHLSAWSLAFLAIISGCCCSFMATLTAAA